MLWIFIKKPISKNKHLSKTVQRSISILRCDTVVENERHVFYNSSYTVSMSLWVHFWYITLKRTVSFPNIKEFQLLYQMHWILSTSPLSHKFHIAHNWSTAQSYPEVPALITVTSRSQLLKQKRTIIYLTCITSYISLNRRIL